MLYVNGVQVAGLEAAGLARSLGIDLALGKASGGIGGNHTSDQAGFIPLTGASDFEGSIAAFRVHEGVLGPEQIEAVYRSAEVSPSLDYEAASDVDSDAIWQTTTTVPNFDWSLGSSIQRVADPDSARNTAYRFDGGGVARLESSLESFLGDPTNNSASFEIRFQPNDLSGQEVLFESGGSGFGTSFTLNDNELQFTVSGGASRTQVLSHPLSSASKFTHAVGVIDLEGTLNGDNNAPDVFLYVDGLKVSEVEIPGLGKWAGGDATALGGNVGGVGGNNQGDLDGFGRYSGDISTFRFYESGLSATTVARLYTATTLDPLLNFDAARNSDGNHVWENASTVAGFDLMLAADADRVIVESGLPSITAAHRFGDRTLVGFSGLTGTGIGVDDQPYFGVEFEHLENIEIRFGDAADHFTINATSEGSSLKLITGGGDDVVRVNEIREAVFVLGGAGNDVVELSDDSALVGDPALLQFDGQAHEREELVRVLRTNLSPEQIAILDDQPLVFADTEPTPNFRPHTHRWPDELWNLGGAALPGSITPFYVAHEERQPIVLEVAPSQQFEIEPGVFVGNTSGQTEIWARTAALDPQTGIVIQDRIQERGVRELGVHETDVSGQALYLDAEGNKTTSNTGVPSYVTDMVDGVPLYLRELPDGRVVKTAEISQALQIQLPETTLVVGEWGQVAGLDEQTQTVVLKHSYVNPVVIVGPPSENGGDAAVVRIFNVASDRFEIAMREASNHDNNHATETVSYFVFEAGRHTLPDGTVIEAGLHETDKIFDPNNVFEPEFVPFSRSFSFTPPFGRPSFFSQVQTLNDDSPAGRYIHSRNVLSAPSGYRIALERDESISGAALSETVGWVAVTKGGSALVAGETGFEFTDAFRAIDFSAQGYDAPPTVLAGIRDDGDGFAGSDPAVLRYRNLADGSIELRVQEDTANDSETTHAAERLDYLLAPGNSGVLQGGGFGEYGTLTAVTHMRQTVALRHAYVDPVIFATIASENGEPAVVRIDGVTSESFDIFLQESSDRDNIAPAETVHYFVFEKGVHTLADGTRIEVGRFDPDGTAFKRVSYSSSFSQPPVVMAQIQTANRVDAVGRFNHVRFRVVEGGGFDIAFEPEAGQAVGNGDPDEIIGWLAVERGGSILRTGKTGRSVTEAYASVDLSGAGLFEAPAMLASIASFWATDPAVARIGNVTADQFQVRVQEDTGGDAETAHAAEEIAYIIAPGGNGVLGGNPVLSLIAPPDPTTDAGRQLWLDQAGRRIDFVPAPRIADVNGTPTVLFVAEPSLIEVDRTLPTPIERSILVSESFAGNDAIRVVSNSDSVRTVATLDGATLTFEGFDANGTLVGGGSFDFDPSQDVRLEFSEQVEIVLRATLPGVGTFITAGAGDDRITVAGADNSLDEILGALHLDAGGGTNTLVLDDSGDTTADTNVIVTAGSVSGLGSTTIHYDATGGVFQAYDLDAQQVLPGIAIHGGSASDTFVVQGSRNNSRLPEVTAIFAGPGNDRVTVTQSDPRHLVVHGGPGGDLLDGTTAMVGFTIHGDEGNDRILGGAGDDLIVGGPDSDVITAGAGNDRLIGGNDFAGGSDAGDTLVGEAGHDTIAGDNATIHERRDVLVWNFESGSLFDTSGAIAFAQTGMALGFDNQPVLYQQPAFIIDKVDEHSPFGGGEYLLRSDALQLNPGFVYLGGGSRGELESTPFTLGSGATIGFEASGTAGRIELVDAQTSTVLESLAPDRDSLTLARYSIDSSAHEGAEVFLRIVADQGFSPAEHLAIDNIVYAALPDSPRHRAVHQRPLLNWDANLDVNASAVWENASGVVGFDAALSLSSNSGTGAITAAAGFLGGTHPIATTANGIDDVEATDLDGDGDIDLVTASFNSNQIAWHENDGAGNFVQHVISLNATGARSVAVADFDGDGDLDVAAGLQSANKITWYENDGSGNFSEQLVTAVSSGAWALRAIDFDGDGDIDIVGALNDAAVGQQSVGWFENDGAGGFTRRTIGTNLGVPRAVFAADLDGDGDMDVLSADELDHMIRWHENAGNGAFVEHVIDAVARGAQDVQAIDLDADGDLDVLSASQLNDKVAWYENDGSGNLTEHVVSTSANWVQSVFAADLDGDADLDLLSALRFDDQIRWYENDGAHNFTEHVLTSAADAALEASAADVDGDGDSDVVGVSLAGDKLAWYENDPPRLTSFGRLNPSDELTSADSLVFHVTFDQSVTGVDVTDFVVSGTTATVAMVDVISASIYEVTASGGNLAALNGIVGLNVSGSHNITDTDGNPLPAAEPPVDEAYTVFNGFRVANVSTYPGLHAAYRFDGTTGLLAAGLTNLPDGIVSDSATIEVWFRPTDLSGKEIIYEAGGGAFGSSFTLDGGTLQFTTSSNSAETTRTLTHELTDVAEFTHAAAVIDKQGAGGVPLVSLYVNGVLADQVPIPGFVSWAGSSAQGFGRTDGGLGGSFGGGLSGFGNFQGDIAAVRIHDRALASSEVEQAFQRVLRAPALAFEAELDVDGDSDWQPVIASGAFEWTLAADVERAPANSTISGIDVAYHFIGAGGGTAATLQTLSGNPTDESASFEMWFKPSDLIGREVLFETGGTSLGTSLTLNAGQLQFTLAHDSLTQLTYPLESADEFVHVVAVVDVGGQLKGDNSATDLFLFVNGALVGELERTGLNDWSGTDGAGLGTVFGAVGGNRGGTLGGYGSFSGEIAAFRFHRRAVTADEAEQSYLSAFVTEGVIDAAGHPLVTLSAHAHPDDAPARIVTLLDHGDNTTAGLFGDDVIVGGSEDDVLLGQLGHDTLRGEDGDDYIEGGGGNDSIQGGLGQDDLIGGSSSLFGLSDSSLRPDGSDVIHGGNADATTRNDLGDTSSQGHAYDADVIVGDNADVYRIASETGYIAYNYDDYGSLKIKPRAVRWLDYVPGDNPAGTIDLGGGDILYGEAGDDQLHGLTGNDVLFGDGQDDDLIGGDGSDRLHGGAGEDGLAGDNGLFRTSRNGRTEQLHGLVNSRSVQTLQVLGYDTGSVEYLDSRLLKQFVAVAFSSGAGDVLYGGLGDDFIHGGAGNDAISGAEAVSSFYNEIIPSSADPLSYDPATRKFATYDAGHPLSKVAGFLLNFESIDGQGAIIEDGKDRIFGDDGHDWIVGGTGSDRMFGGLGDDLLQTDDNLDTNNGLNDGTEVEGLDHADFAFGGGGLDVLIANTGADRLVDWRGDFNTFAAPFATAGPTVTRDISQMHANWIIALALASGVDPSLAEPAGELGLVTSADPQWSSQTGPARDPLLPPTADLDQTGGVEDDRAFAALPNGSTPGNTASSLAEGTAINGYLVGATVWFDADRDGVIDPHEPRTTTNSEGQFSLSVPENLDMSAGVYRMRGGVDVTTGLPNLSTFSKLPDDHMFITPLTTAIYFLVEQGMDSDAAHAMIHASLGISDEVDLDDFDHFEEARRGNPNAARVLIGLTNIHSLVVSLHHLLTGLASAPAHQENLSHLTSNAVFAAIAERRLSEGSIDLRDLDDLRAVIRSAAAHLAPTLNQFGVELSPDPQLDEALVNGVARILQAASVNTFAIAAEATSGHDLVTKVTKSKLLAHGDSAEDLHAVGAGLLTIEQAVARHAVTGPAALQAIRDASLPPHMSHVKDFTLLEDGSLTGYVLTVFDFESLGSELTITATSDNASLLPSQNIVITLGSEPGERLLSLTPIANRSGVATITLRLEDEHGHHHQQEFVVTVLEVNDEPTFQPGRSQVTNIGGGVQQLAWADNILAGSLEEQQSDQFLSFTLTLRPGDESLFSEKPSIDAATGVLRFVPNPQASGVAKVTAVLRDSGGSDHGGRNVSAPVTFNITVLPTAPTIDVLIVEVTPDPRTDAVDELTIVFGHPVVGFDLSDLTLRRDDGEDLLAGSPARLSSANGSVWTLGELNEITRLPGRYTLALDAAESGITSTSGVLATEDAIEAWDNVAVLGTISLSPSTAAENLSGPMIGTLAVLAEPGTSHEFSVDDPRFEVVGDTLKLKEGVSLSVFREPSVPLEVTARETSGQTETHLLVIHVTANPFPWRNGRNRFDANDDGDVSPIDALLVINLMKQPAPLLSAAKKLPTSRPATAASYFDVSGDGYATAIDVLHVVNFLDDSAVEAEGGNEPVRPSFALAGRTVIASSSLPKASPTVSEFSSPRLATEEYWRSRAADHDLDLLIDRPFGPRATDASALLDDALEQCLDDLADDITGEWGDVRPC